MELRRWTHHEEIAGSFLDGGVKIGGSVFEIPPIQVTVPELHMHACLNAKDASFTRQTPSSPFGDPPSLKLACSANCLCALNNSACKNLSINHGLLTPQMR
jgi:hypothetical protein